MKIQHAVSLFFSEPLHKILYNLLPFHPPMRDSSPCLAFTEISPLALGFWELYFSRTCEFTLSVLPLCVYICVQRGKKQDRMYGVRSWAVLCPWSWLQQNSSQETDGLWELQFCLSKMVNFWRIFKNKKQFTFIWRIVRRVATYCYFRKRFYLHSLASPRLSFVQLLNLQEFLLGFAPTGLVQGTTLVAWKFSELMKLKNWIWSYKY